METHFNEQKLWTVFCHLLFILQIFHTWPFYISSIFLLFLQISWSKIVFSEKTEASALHHFNNLKGSFVRVDISDKILVNFLTHPKVPVFYWLMKKFKSLNFYQNFFFVILYKSRWIWSRLVKKVIKILGKNLVNWFFSLNSKKQRL